MFSSSSTTIFLLLFLAGSNELRTELMKDNERFRLPPLIPLSPNESSLVVFSRNPQEMEQSQRNVRDLLDRAVLTLILKNCECCSRKRWQKLLSGVSAKHCDSLTILEGRLKVYIWAHKSKAFLPFILSLINTQHLRAELLFVVNWADFPCIQGFTLRRPVDVLISKLRPHFILIKTTQLQVYFFHNWWSLQQHLITWIFCSLYTTIDYYHNMVYQTFSSNSEIYVYKDKCWPAY